MITILTLLQEDSRHLQQIREQTAQMVAVCNQMSQARTPEELLHLKRAYRRLAEKQDETNYRHNLRVRGISKRLNMM